MNQQEIKHPEEPHTTGCHLSATSLSIWVSVLRTFCYGTLRLNYVRDHDMMRLWMTVSSPNLLQVLHRLISYRLSIQPTIQAIWNKLGLVYKKHQQRETSVTYWNHTFSGLQDKISSSLRLSRNCRNLLSKSLAKRSAIFLAFKSRRTAIKCHQL